MLGVLLVSTAAVELAGLSPRRIGSPLVCALAGIYLRVAGHRSSTDIPGDTRAAIACQPLRHQGW